MAENMKAKYENYWGDVKKMNILLFVAVVLDPRHKMQFVRWGLNKVYEKNVAESLYKKTEETLYKIFDSYRIFVGQGQSEVPTHSSLCYCSVDSCNNFLKTIVVPAMLLIFVLLQKN
ncbi:unnamed protein product [Lathyrus oleraceus]